MTFSVRRGDVIAFWVVFLLLLGPSQTFHSLAKIFQMKFNFVSVLLKCLLFLICKGIEVGVGEGNGNTPVLLPGESHGRRSLVGCSSGGREELDKTERLHFHFSLSCIGEGNGHPLQCSCLENPRDRVAWWAAVYGVAQSWTRLKWLSSMVALFLVF